MVTHSRLIVLGLFLAAASTLVAQQPATAAHRPTNVQQLLEILASPAKFTNTPKPLPALYAEWTEDERGIGLRQIAGRCTVLWVMMNDAGPATLLPPAQDPADSQKLATETCIAAHLPTDWPGRPAAIADLRRILTRSTQLGQTLTLPAPLAK